MSDGIEFVSNYNDLSTDRGFQFEFCCNRCHSGYRTPFKAWAVGTASAVLDTASGLFGGLFGSAATVGERVRSATWEKSHDDAFASALEEIRPSFVQCPRCNTWVCRKSCWNKAETVQGMRPRYGSGDVGRPGQSLGRGGLGPRGDGRRGQAPGQKGVAGDHPRYLSQL